MGTVFVCSCPSSKKHRLTFNGGSAGQYDLEICQKCYDQEDKQFLISEECFDEIIAKNTRRKTRSFGGAK